MNKKNKGISLIMLVIAIIITIILAGAIILSLSSNSPIDSTKEMKFKIDMKNVQNEVLLYSTSVFADGDVNYYPIDANGKLDNTIIKSVNGYDDKLEIYNNLLTFTGTDATEIEWAIEVGLNIRTPMLANNIVQISAGDNFSTAVYSDSTVRSWGANSVSQLGNGNNDDKNTPELVMQDLTNPLYNVTEIATGARTSLVLLEDGSVTGWGDNYEGELGSGFPLNNNDLSVKNIPEFTDTKRLAVGGTASYNIKNTLTVNYLGNDGNPIDISSLANVNKISSGRYHTLALLFDGNVWAWGDNGNGSLGDGTMDSSSIPVQTNITNVTQVSVGGLSSYFLLDSKEVKACGENYSGQLATGDYEAVYIPELISGLNNVKSISAGKEFVLALLENGTVMSWGVNGYGQLGNGNNTDSIVPTLIPDLANVVQISAGAYHSMALLSDGNIMTWGYNYNGQLGDGTTDSRNIPTLINAKFPSTPPPS